MGTVNMSEAVNLISQPVSGLILAGGEGRRMSGRDKGLITLANKPLIEYAIACLSPLVDDLTISCNRNQEQYADYQLPCVLDSLNPIEGGNAQFANELITGYIESFETLSVDYKKALLSKDLERIRFIAHKNKSSIALLGFDPLLAEVRNGVELLKGKPKETALENSTQKVTNFCTTIINDLKSCLK